MSSVAMAIPPQKHPKVRKVILITSNKGGTGKTTLGVNLASAAASNGYNVCALDFDTQHSFDRWSLRRKRFAIAQVPVYAGTLEHYKRLIDCTLGHEIVVIDTPPAITDDPAMVELIRLADFIIVPTQTSILDIEAVSSWIGVMQREKEKMGNANAIAFLINRVNLRSNEIRDALSSLIRHGRVCGTTIRDLTSIQRSMKSGHSIVDVMSETEKGKQDFLDVWHWIEREMGIGR